MTMRWPLMTEGKGLDLSARLAEDSGLEPVGGQRGGDDPAIAAHAHPPGPKPDRKKMAVLGGAYPIAPHPRTAAAVVESLFSDPRARPEHPFTPRPVPQQKRRCAVLPAAAVAEALAVPRPTAVVFTWLLAEARQRDPDHQHAWVLLMDGQHALWDAAAATFGDTARVEILDLLHVTGYRWEAVDLFLPAAVPWPPP